MGWYQSLSNPEVHTTADAVEVAQTSYLGYCLHFGKRHLQGEVMILHGYFSMSCHRHPSFVANVPSQLAQEAILLSFSNHFGFLELDSATDSRSHSTFSVSTAAVISKLPCLHPYHQGSLWRHCVTVVERCCCSLGLTEGAHFYWSFART